MLFLPIRCLLRCGPQPAISLRFLSLGSNLLAQRTRKWTKAELQPLIEWAEETESIYGPVLNSKRKPVEKSVAKKEKKVTAPKVKTSVKKSAKATSSNATTEVKSRKVSKQKSEFVEVKVERNVLLNRAAAEDTMDYEEVSDQDVSMSPLMATSSALKAATSLPPDEAPPASEFQRDSKNGCEDVSSVMSSIPTKDASGSLGLKDSEGCASVSSGTTGTGGFLSKILAFPPFTIAWNATGGRRSIGEAAKNSTDVEPAVRDAGYPSVSAILKATMPPESRFFLERWEKEMIEELGEDGFHQYKQGKNSLEGDLLLLIYSFRIFL